MNATFKHSKCGGQISMVLVDTAFFCMSPRISPNGVSLSLGEIGKFDESVGLVVVDKDTTFSVAWSCLECGNSLTAKDADDILAVCSSCHKSISVSDAVTTRGYSCLCQKCLKVLKKQKDKSPRNKKESERKVAPVGIRADQETGREPSPLYTSDESRWGAPKKTATYSAKPFISIMFDDAKFKRSNR